MKTVFNFVATVLLSISAVAANSTTPTTQPIKANPSIELGTRIGPVDTDIEKKMLKYIRSQGTLSGLVGAGQGWTSHIVAIRCQIPEGPDSKNDKPHCEFVEVKEPEIPAKL